METFTQAEGCRSQAEEGTPVPGEVPPGQRGVNNSWGHGPELSSSGLIGGSGGGGDCNPKPDPFSSQMRNWRIHYKLKA